MTETSHLWVREEMLRPAPPPLREAGAVKWLRENLISSPVNTLLTFAGLLVTIWMIWTAFPWWWHSVWNANSLAECREIVAAAGGESGACWAVIKARWHQFLFGFFPPEQYWRPVLTGGLLFAALAPILFWKDRKSAHMVGFAGIATLAALYAISANSLAFAATAAIFAVIWVTASLRPAALIWVTGLFPFISIWLIWGGSFWSPVTQLLAIALGALVARLYYNNPNKWLNDAFALVVALAAAWVASVVINYSDAISTDFFARLRMATFWQGFGQGGNILAMAFGALASFVVMLLTAAIWLLLAVMYVISAVLNYNLTDLARLFGYETLPAWAAMISLGALFAFALVFVAARNRSVVIGVLAGLLAGGGWLLYQAPKMVSYMATDLPLTIAPVGSNMIGGFLLALIIGVTAIAASLPLGIMLALGRRSDMWLMKMLSIGFIEFIRGVPLITLLFTASLLLQYFLPPQTNFDLILRVIILASLFSAAYLAEVIRGGLAALPRGQYEAGDSLGLTYWQAQRLIIMPQALKISIPGIVSTFIGLFKDTTLVSFVGLLDPLRGVTTTVRADINWKGIYWEPYIFVGAIFFIICFGMSRYSMYLERKLKTDHR
ncbi:amine acid ABC transporter, permease protein, 3-TM region, His/Glu/Gln/Arg/opine family [Rhodobacter sp. 24-YEA-8]|nr:amine acid ABC transporter, permease protein, 3-TM region, His/Glu/Gln/Arg/opine family [Rhodobacter sp. 24-YEA-8]